MTVDKNKTYRTHSCLQVRIYEICDDGPYPVHGAILGDDGVWRATSWTLRGAINLGGFTNNDLVEVRQKRVAYMNAYPDDRDPVVHDDRASADRFARQGRVARVRIEYEEGQFDD